MKYNFITVRINETKLRILRRLKKRVKKHKNGAIWKTGCDAASKIKQRVPARTDVFSTALFLLSKERILRAAICSLMRPEVS